MFMFSPSLVARRADRYLAWKSVRMQNIDGHYGGNTCGLFALRTKIHSRRAAPNIA
jgi:hypothetical protein